MWLFLLVAVSSSWIHTVNLTFSGRYLRNNNYIITAFNNAYPRRRYNNNFCLGDVWFLREDNNVTCNMFVNSHTMVNEVHKVIPFCATFSCSTNMQLIFFQTSWMWPNTFIKPMIRFAMNNHYTIDDVININSIIVSLFVSYRIQVW